MHPFIVSLLLLFAIGWVAIRNSRIKYDPLFHQLIMIGFVISFITLSHFWHSGKLAMTASSDSSILETLHNILAYAAPVAAAIGGIGGIFWNIKSESTDPIAQVKIIQYNGKAKVSIVLL